MSADAALSVSATQKGGQNIVSAMTVLDNVNNVQLNLENLKNIGDTLKIITVNDEGTLAFSQSEFENHSSVLDKILGNIDIIVE